MPQFPQAEGLNHLQASPEVRLLTRCEQCGHETGTANSPTPNGGIEILFVSGVLTFLVLRAADTRIWLFIVFVPPVFIALSYILWNLPLWISQYLSQLHHCPNCGVRSRRAVRYGDMESRDLNHLKVRSFSREIARELALEPSFVDFVFAENRPECFRNWVGDLQGSWTCYVPDAFDVAYPLWSTNADQTLILRKGDSISFGKGWHDNPEMEMISETTQGLLTYLMEEVISSSESDEECIQAAQFCSYKFLDELLQLMEQTPDGSYRDTLKRFIADVDARSR